MGGNFGKGIICGRNGKQAMEKEWAEVAVAVECVAESMH